jgi:hypothetical protein
MFGSFGAGFGSFGAGVGGLLPSFTNITSWLKTPTADGKTLDNSKGADATLTGVNCLGFDGVDDHIDLQTVPSDLLQGVFDIEFDVLIDDSDTSYQRVLWFVTTGNAFFRIQKNVNANTFDFWARNSSSNTVFRTTSLAFTPDTIFNFRAVGDGTDVKVYYNDVLQITISINASNKESTFTPSDPSLGSSSTSMKGKLSNFKMSSGGVLHTHLPLAEGSGTRVYDVSGNGNYGTITSATWSTANNIESWNHQYGFDTDIFRGYPEYWDLASSGSGTWTQNESNLTLTGNTGSSGRIRQVVYGMVSGETLVVSGTIVQTGGSGAGADVGISANSAGWVEGTILLGGEVGTYTFSKTLNANSSTCDIQFIAVNAANIVISDLKFTVVKKIPALNFKTKQVATFDGSADHIDLSSGFTLGTSWEIETTLAVLQLETKAGEGMGWFFRDSSASDTISRTVTPTDRSDFNTYKVVRDGNTITYYINGSSVATDDASSLGNIVIANPIIGARSGDSNFFSGSFKTWKLTISGSVAVEYDFQSNIGTNTIQDLSGNNNDGAVTVGSGALDSFWGTRVADTAGSLVSANYAIGNTNITNPAGFVHNGSECGVAMVTNSLTSTQLFAIDNSTATETFVRKDNGNIVQILDYSAPLTGDDLARTRSYVG